MRLLYSQGRGERTLIWMNECVFIYRTYHIMSQGGLQEWQGYLLYRKIVWAAQKVSSHNRSHAKDFCSTYCILGIEPKTSVSIKGLVNKYRGGVGRSISEIRGCKISDPPPHNKFLKKPHETRRRIKSFTTQAVRRSAAHWFNF